MRIDLALDGDRVAAAGFEASGCGAAVAAGSAAVELVQRRASCSTRRGSARAEIAAELGGLSPGKLHAADLAADALHVALGAAVAATGALTAGAGAHARGDERRRGLRRRGAARGRARGARRWR